MLKCSCGWEGVNLVPCFATDTAHCPNCHRIFEDIPAKRAISQPPTSHERERQFVHDSCAMFIFAQSLENCFENRR